MTDPKLVEKARELIREYCDGTFMKDERKWEIVGCPKAIIDEIVLALQSHGDEVRRKTVEEAMKAVCLYCEKGRPFKNNGHPHRGHKGCVLPCYAKAIRKLLEVKP